MKILMPGFRKQPCASLVSACLLVATSPLFALSDDHLPSHKSGDLRKPATVEPLLSRRASHISRLTPLGNASIANTDEGGRALTSVLGVPEASQIPENGNKANKLTKAKLQASRSSSGITFIENKGQFDERVKFQVANAGGILWLTEGGIVFDFQQCGVPTQSVSSKSELAQIAKLEQKKSSDCGIERHVINQDFLGSNQDLKIETKGVQPGVRNYLAGSDPAKWQTQVRGFSEVVYHDVWPGIDLRLYGKGPDLEQEFVVNPGADATRVQLAYRGVDKLKIGNDGSLIVRAAAGHMRETSPHIYQKISGRRVSVNGRFKLLSSRSYTLEIGAYDKRQPLVIDPTLLYSTFLGGSAGNNLFTIGTRESASGIAVDQAGNAYITGFTQSPDFPVTPGAFQTGLGGGQQTFITKLNPTGSALVYSTFLNAPFVSGIAVDQNGNAYIVGNASFVGNGVVTFPSTPNAFSQSCNGTGYLTVLNPNGNGLVYSSCFGNIILNSIVTDGRGRAFITGYSGGPNLPTTANAYQSSYPGARQTSAVVIAVDTTLSGTDSLLYASYFGIPSANTSAYGTIGNGIAVDPFGNIYITGYAGDGLPVTPGAFQEEFATGINCNPFGGAIFVCPDAYVAKINPSAAGDKSLIYATYLGGPGTDIANAISVDSSGNAYIAGITNSAAFPVTPGAFETTPPIGIGGSNVGFVTKLNAAGSGLVYSTYLESRCTSAQSSCFTLNPGISISAIAVDALGEAYVTGSTLTTLFPVTPDALQGTKSSSDDAAFLTKLNASGSALVYSSYLGGGGDDVATAVAVDQTGDPYIAGHTSSANFPTSVAFQPTMHGTGDAFVAKLALGAGGPLSILTVYPGQGGNSGAVTPTIVGSGFHYGAAARLNCSDGSSIAGGNSTVNPDGRTLTATFSLSGKAPGLCSVAVVNPDGTTISMPSAFTVISGGAEDIQLDLFGRSGIRGGIWTSYSAGYSNRGTVDSRPFRLWVSFPDYFSWSPPPDRPPSSSGALNGNIYVGFDIPSVPAGASAWIPIQLVAPSTPEFGHRQFTVQAWREKN